MILTRICFQIVVHLNSYITPVQYHTIGIESSAYMTSTDSYQAFQSMSTNTNIIRPFELFSNGMQYDYQSVMSQRSLDINQMFDHNNGTQMKFYCSTCRNKYQSFHISPVFSTI